MCVWTILAIFAILAISMARSKNTGKIKATSSSMERAVKKRKANTSQTMKRVKESEKALHQRMRKEMRAKMKKLKLCLLNPRNPSKKGGSNQLKDEVSTISEE